MDSARIIEWLGEEMHLELVDHILPYWMDHALDREHGGFVGRIDINNRVIAGSPKGTVLNARILWSFAAAYRALRLDEYLDVASRAFQYLVEHFLDADHGGVYWTLDHTGRPLDTGKRVYAQAFAIYGLAEYALATGDDTPRNVAVDVYHALERNAADSEHGGYAEAFSREWIPAEGAKLSPDEPDFEKSMNTHLHVLEAYTSLFRVWPDESLRQRLARLVDLFMETIVDPESHHLVQFFDGHWRPLSSRVSFGHDIEASWLIPSAAQVVDDGMRQSRARDVCLRIARVTMDEGMSRDGGLINQVLDDGAVDTDRHWWPQAEAMVGFLNGYQQSGDQEFLAAAASVWVYTRDHLVDRVKGEWFFRVDREGNPYLHEDKVGLWKCPYHNVRACLEVMRRTAEFATP